MWPFNIFSKKKTKPSPAITAKVVGNNNSVRQSSYVGSSSRESYRSRSNDDGYDDGVGMITNSIIMSSVISSYDDTATKRYEDTYTPSPSYDSGSSSSYDSGSSSSSSYDSGSSSSSSSYDSGSSSSSSSFD